MSSHTKVRILEGSIHIRKVPEFLKELASFSLANNTVIQAMDATKVAGEEHVLFAVAKAQQAIEGGYNAARDIGLEVMRYASGKRQIEEAFSMGLHEGDMDLVLVVIGSPEGVERSVSSLKGILCEKKVIGYSPAKKNLIMQQFDISELELSAVGEEMLPHLVIERVALVDVLK